MNNPINFFIGFVFFEERVRFFGLFPLFLEVIPDEKLLAHVVDYAGMLAAKPPIALSLIKTGLNQLTNSSFDEAIDWEASAQAVCLGSDDFREAMRAWATKSDGKYSGK